MSKRTIEINRNESEVPVSLDKVAFAKLIDDYKRYNPAKYEQKKVALLKQLEEMS